MSEKTIKIGKETYVDYSDNVIVKDALRLIKDKMGAVEKVPIVLQTPNMKLMHESFGDISEYAVHGYDRDRRIIIVPQKPEISSVAHEYGHFLFHEYGSSLDRVKIPSSFKIDKNTEQFNIFHDNKDEWFAYHFGLWIADKSKDWHPEEKKLFVRMKDRIKVRAKGSLEFKEWFEGWEKAIKKSMLPRGVDYV